jgi:transcriptional regulator with XRE-family HTH domain
MGIREIQEHIKELRRLEKEQFITRKQELDEKFTKIQAKTLFTFGVKLKRLRTMQGLSQEDIGFQVGLSRVAITNMEAAAQDITLTNIVKLAMTLNCEISDLIPPTEVEKEDADYISIPDNGEVYELDSNVDFTVTMIKEDI